MIGTKGSTTHKKRRIKEMHEFWTVLDFRYLHGGIN